MTFHDFENNIDELWLKHDRQSKCSLNESECREFLRDFSSLINIDISDCLDPKTKKFERKFEQLDDEGCERLDKQQVAVLVLNVFKNR